MTMIVYEEERCLIKRYDPKGMGDVARTEGIRTVVRTDEGKYYAIDTRCVAHHTIEIETMIFSCLDEEHDYYIVDWREHYFEHYETMDEARKRHHEIANDFDNVMQSDESCPSDWREYFSPNDEEDLDDE